MHDRSSEKVLRGQTGSNEFSSQKGSYAMGTGRLIVSKVYHNVSKKPVHKYLSSVNKVRFNLKLNVVLK